MRQMKWAKFALAATAAAVMVACGGGSDGGTGGPATSLSGGTQGNGNPKIAFSSLVSFGDSLSDVGSYNVGTVKALSGGKYTVNGASAKIWVEQLAAQLKLSAPCAAETGLDGLASQGFSFPSTKIAGCTAYGQGGSRVTNPVGPGNKLLGGANAVLGQLTVPVLTQMQNHLAAAGGAYKGDEVVFVLAGGNDVFINLAVFDGTVKAGGDPQAAGVAAVTAMGQAGAELAGYIKALVLAKGAKYVVSVNLPDVSKTPFAYSLGASAAGLINTMSKTFNDQLKAGLAGTEANVAQVDAFTVSVDQAANPGQYGITNATGTACDLTPAKNPLGSSLVCNATNVIAGDTSHYQYADGVHPTPYGYQLLAQLVSLEMAKKGWL
jgi:outer membrane lipase/esterase